MSKLWIEDIIHESHIVHYYDLNRDYNDIIYQIAKHNENSICREVHGSSGFAF